MKRPGSSSTPLKWFSGFASLLVAACLAAAPAQAAKCVNPGGTGGCFDTIQAAVTAAVAGETVTVRPGIYNELVVIDATKPGLRLVGAGTKPGKVVVSGLGLVGPVIQVQADTVQIRNLTVANGSLMGILFVPGNLGNPGALISGVVVRGCAGTGIQLAGSGEVRSCTIRACGAGLICNGAARFVARQNTIEDCGFGMGVDGSELLVTGNRVTTGPQGISVTASVKGVVENNRVQAVKLTGIQVLGPTPGAVLTVRGNTVQSIDRGIAASGQTLVVEHNTVRATNAIGITFVCTDATGSALRNNRVEGGNTGISAENHDAANGLEVSGNTVHGSMDNGISVNGSRNDIRRNVVASDGYGLYGSGLMIIGTQNTVAQNKALNNGGAGILVLQSDNQLTGNIASGNVVGIQVDNDGNALLNNTTSGNARYGVKISIGAGGTTVQDSTARGNLGWDFCDAGGPTTLIGNHFGTTATVCP